MNRVAFALTLSVCGTFLTACGDTGDHFLEFRKTASQTVTVAKMGLAMPVMPSFTTAGVYPLTVAAFDSKGAAFPTGSTFAHPIVLTSNVTACTLPNGTVINPIGFGADPSFVNQDTEAAITVTNSNMQVFVAFTPGCTAPGTNVITASDIDAPQVTTFTF
jgi:hypothetical protein